MTYGMVWAKRASLSCKAFQRAAQTCRCDGQARDRLNRRHGLLEKHGRSLNSSTPANEDAKDDRLTTQPCFREIGFPAVAAALCCARMPPPTDEHDDKHARDDATARDSGDYWVEEVQGWFGVP